MPLRVRFYKDHVRWKKDQEAVLDNTQAVYLENMKVVEIIDGPKPEDTEKTLLKHLEPEKKDKTAKAAPQAEPKPKAKKKGK